MVVVENVSKGRFGKEVFVCGGVEGKVMNLAACSLTKGTNTVGHVLDHVLASHAPTRHDGPEQAAGLA